MDWSLIFTPCVGGVIGYITNDIAIRMLFRPHKAKYIFGWHIPFTPGIIPKEKGRIAEAIGWVISENLMNQEVLQRYLLSEDMVGKVRNAVESFIAEQKTNEETLEQYLLHYISKEELDGILKDMSENVSVQVHNKVSNPALGEQIAHITMEHVSNNLNEEDAGNIVEEMSFDNVMFGMGNAIKGVAKKVVGVILGMVSTPIENYLAKNINGILQENGSVFVSNMLDDEMNKLLATPVKHLLENRDAQLDKVVKTIESLYQVAMTDHLPKILDSIDISKIVRERIMEMDVAETEKLILLVMNKELKAIVWLGALLGMMMGCINIFIK